MIASYLRRGMAAGLLAGLLAGLFAFFSGEPFIDRAIELEQASAGAGQGEEVFSRAIQKVGLFFATGVYGVTIGGVFGLAFAYFRGRLASSTEWSRSLSFTGAVFAGVSLIPFVKYPANPPTVGDPETIGARTVAYLVMVVFSVFAVLAAWYVARMLRGRGISSPARQIAVGLGFVGIMAAGFLGLPASADPGDFPAGWLWSYRVSSLGTLLVFWTGLGVMFGLLCERANRTRSLEG